MRHHFHRNELALTDEGNVTLIQDAYTLNGRLWYDVSDREDEDLGVWYNGQYRYAIEEKDLRTLFQGPVYEDWSGIEH